MMTVKCCNEITITIATRHRASRTLANILRSRYVARTPQVEARSPGRRSNVENAHRHPPVTGQLRAQTPAERSQLRTMSSCRGIGASL